MKHKCPICEGEVDTEHYAFVLETIKDKDKLTAWMRKEWSFEKWKEQNGRLKHCIGEGK